MSNLNADPGNPEITYSDALRDKIFEHMPRQTRQHFVPVEVKFWPSNHGVIELQLAYDSILNSLRIRADESIEGPDEKLTGLYVRSCGLNATTAQILTYKESMFAEYDPALPINPSLVEAEINTVRFNPDKHDFLLGLFDNL